ncbi:hypothetical protein VB005_09284 [Metarhizium brunneum]
MVVLGHHIRWFPYRGILSPSLARRFCVAYKAAVPPTPPTSTIESLRVVLLTFLFFFSAGLLINLYVVHDTTINMTNEEEYYHRITQPKRWIL